MMGEGMRSTGAPAGFGPKGPHYVAGAVTAANSKHPKPLEPDSMRKFLALTILLAGPAASLGHPQSGPAPVIGHEIQARLDPAAGLIEVQDRLALPEGHTSWDLILHRDLHPRVIAGKASLERVSQEGHLESLRLTQEAPGPVTLAYGGRIQHGLDSALEGMGRERQSTPGTIGPDGIFLDGSSGWYPRVPGSLQTFELEVSLPQGWRAVSQGAGPELAGHAGTHWSESHPQDDIYLVAAPFTLYREPGPGFEAQVWLRRPDPELAASYLAATRDYVAFYSQLIGPYPYTKFALVENFWETGYGMPSFTLLGPQVIRLPFIIHTSYPHEVLHNWWGNGVYVDYESGNWSEGLTAYLSDHLMAERAGRGADYRRDTVKAYSDYVRDAEDFPLTAFRARHSSASQAIGYGKSAMVFHMLRRRLGDASFLHGLDRFYRDNRFHTASWTDLQDAFQSVSGQDLGGYFDAWTTRVGAPRLALREVSVERTREGFRVSGRLEQQQAQPPFPLMVPLLVHQEDGPPVALTVSLDERTRPFAVELPSAPVRLAVDPGFDTFRELLPGESPAALSNLFGAATGLIVLPGEGAARAPGGLSGPGRGLDQGTPRLARRHGHAGSSAAQGRRRVGPGVGQPPRPEDGQGRPRVRAPAREGGAATRRAHLRALGLEPRPDPHHRRPALGLAGRVTARGPRRARPQAATLRQVRLPRLLRRTAEERAQGPMAAG